VHYYIFYTLAMIKNNDMRHAIWWLVGFMALTLMGCVSEDRKDDTETVGFSKNQEELMEAVYYRFPSASEMFNYVHKDELTYNENIVNSLDLVDNYQTTEAKLLNLGVYMADLSYLMVFEERQLAQKYLQSVQQLTSELRIEPPFEEAFITRMKQNVHRTDSLAKIADEFSSRVMDYLMATGREKYLAIITTGGYIEALYLALYAIDEKELNGLSTRIAEQKYAIGNLFNFIQQYPGEKTRLANDILNQLDGFFAQLEVEKEQVNAHKDSDGKLILTGGERIHITPSEFGKLQIEIKEIRNHVIQAK